jgi:hypothetical protein
MAQLFLSRGAKRVLHWCDTVDPPRNMHARFFNNLLNFYRSVFGVSCGIWQEFLSRLNWLQCYVNIFDQNSNWSQNDIYHLSLNFFAFLTSFFNTWVDKIVKTYHSLESSWVALSGSTISCLIRFSGEKCIFWMFLKKPHVKRCFLTPI